MIQDNFVDFKIRRDHYNFLFSFAETSLDLQPQDATQCDLCAFSLTGVV